MRTRARRAGPGSEAGQANIYEPEPGAMDAAQSINGSRRSHRRQPQDLSRRMPHKREVEDDGAVETVPRHGGDACLLLRTQRRAVYQKTL